MATNSRSWILETTPYKSGPFPWPLPPITQSPDTLLCLLHPHVSDKQKMSWKETICCFKFWGFSLLIAKKLYISKLIVFIKKQTHMNKNTSKSEHEKHISLQTTERHSTFQQLCVLLFKNKQVFLCQRWRWTFVYYNTCKRDISFEIFFIHVYPRVRCLLTINGGNVINASCLTAQYFNY